MSNNYISPGVYTVERDITVVKFEKKYLRRIKIGRIFDFEVSNVIITSTPKGSPSKFPQIW